MASKQRCTHGDGNAIIPDIAKAIFDSIIMLDNTAENLSNTFFTDSVIVGERDGYEFKLDNKRINVMPTRGVALSDTIYSDGKCELLNVPKQRYEGLFSTLLRKDGNNNFTCKSRLNRPGKLGGLVGEIMAIGADTGGLHPHFCEAFMGYPRDHTALPVHLA